LPADPARASEIPITAAPRGSGRAPIGFFPQLRYRSQRGSRDPARGGRGGGSGGAIGFRFRLADRQPLPDQPPAVRPGAALAALSRAAFASPIRGSAAVARLPHGSSGPRTSDA